VPLRPLRPAELRSQPGAEAEAILDALLTARERGKAFALGCLQRTVRRGSFAAQRRSFLPGLEALEPRYVFNAPAITAISPDSGPVTGGVPVTITGSGFTGTNAVYFGNGQPAGFLVLSDNAIRATSPAENPGFIDITVVNADGSSAPTPADQYHFTNQPSIIDVSPSQGSTAGGNSVLITGTNLGSATAVLFGDTPATSFSVSKGQITATAPKHAAGVVDVQVVTANGTAALAGNGAGKGRKRGRKRLFFLSFLPSFGW
jgi:hypothetical protein